MTLSWRWDAGTRAGSPKWVASMPGHDFMIIRELHGWQLFTRKVGLMYWQQIGDRPGTIDEQQQRAEDWRAGRPVA